MKVKIAYIEEPPFGWTKSDQTATGADVDLADTVLRAIGVTQIEHHLTTFSELLSGVEAGRWDMNECSLPAFGEGRCVAAARLLQRHLARNCRPYQRGRCESCPDAAECRPCFERCSVQDEPTAGVIRFAESPVR